MLSKSGQVHRAGDKLFIDYSGDTRSVIDARTGEVREAQIFVCVLGASNYAYVEATWTQTLPDWTPAATQIPPPVARANSSR